MEGDSNSTDVLRDADLCVLMPTPAVGISEYVTATNSMPSSSSTEVGFAPSSGNVEPSASNGVSVLIERLMQVRSEFGNTVEFEIEASKDHWSELHPSSDKEETMATDLEEIEEEIG